VRDGDDSGRETTRTREAGGKKEGRRKDCGMDISSLEGGAAAGRRRLWNFQGRRKCRRDDWAKMDQVLVA